MMSWLLWGFLGWVTSIISGQTFTHIQPHPYSVSTYTQRELHRYPLQQPSLRQYPLRILIFLDTECPICQKTTQRIQKLADQYANQVKIEAIYPTETVTLADVKAFERAFKLTIPHRLDPSHKLVRQYNATTTPEVILLSEQNEILYRGSVDDQFYRLGRYRPVPTEFYLKDAVEAALSRKPVVVRQTTPTGCLINRQ